MNSLIGTIFGTQGNVKEIPGTAILLNRSHGSIKQAVWEAADTICPRPCKLTFDLLTLKGVSESCVTWPTSVPILVLLGLSVLDLGPMYAPDRQTSDSYHRLMPLPYGRGHNNSRK